MSTGINDLMKEFLGKHSGLICSSVGMSALSHGIYTLIMPRLLTKIFNDKEQIPKNVAMFLGAFTCEKASHTIANYLSNMLEPALVEFITERFVKAVFDKYEATSKPIEVAVLVKRIDVIRNALEDLVYYTCFKLMPLMIVITITLVSIFKLNFKLGLCVLVSCVLLFVVLFKLPRNVSTLHTNDELNAQMEDVFNNIEFISTAEHGYEKAEALIKEKLIAFRDVKKASIKRVSTNQGIGYACAAVLYIGSVVYLYRLFKEGAIALKDFEAHLLIIGKLYDLAFDVAYYLPIHGKNLSIIRRSDAYVRDLFQYSGKQYAQTEMTDFCVKFEGVDFSYDSLMLFREFCYTVEEGTMLALYGPSGSGKTTLTNLLLRLARPDQGVVTIGGIPVDDINPRLLRKYVAIVRQNTSSLLCGTIYDNIAFGYTGIRNRVESICSEFGVGEIFNDVNFLDKVVLKNGSNLSGGQKQIVHLLHALCNENLRLIVLDEPTSALDMKSKGVVIELIKQIHSAGRTVIIITHDPQVKAICTKVLMFKRGYNPK